MSDLKERILALETYEIQEHRWLPDIGSDSYVLRHVKSGARIALLSNEDSNKVFYIAFRTPPADSTGVAHIIEHTVLCGSRAFPVKDPFVEAVKGSLNTFLNAMTYPDKTVYPVASTNEKDFCNLMHIYLDAVFRPNIYTEQNIFRQEGWHYEVSDSAAAGNTEPEIPGEGIACSGHEGSDGSGSVPVITVNGVVYNEMKGVMSSPEDVLNDQVLASLFPDTTYAIVSGGDPEVIPDLTYEQYLDFHRTCYHPSNAYIYLYGDMDMEERLRFLDEEYLSEYDRIDPHSEIYPQAPFTERRDVTKHYSIQKDEDPAGKAFLSWNAALPMHGSPKEILAFRILDYVLCDAEGAPVKEALRGQGIGQDVESLYEPGVYEPYYSITAKYADPEQKGAFLTTIRSVLEQLADDGIPRRALQAGINYYEFQYREADFGSYPKGLIYGLDICDTWLYDDAAVWTNLDVGGYYDELKRDAEQGYFEGLIRRLLLDNPHESFVLLLPEQGLTEKMEEVQRRKMADFAASLAPEQLQQIRDDEASLRNWQETPDREEDIRRIPVLERSDLTRKAPEPINDTVSEHVVGHPVFTSGIDYVDIAFDVTHFSTEQLHTLSLYKTLLCALDTEKYSYSELDNEINITTGGMSPGIGTSVDAHDPSRYRVRFGMSFKTMHENLPEALELAEEILLHTSFADSDRIREVLEEECASMKADLPAAGHSTAVMRAASYLSSCGKTVDDLAGIGAYRNLQSICRDYDAAAGDLAGALSDLREAVLSGGIQIDITAQSEHIKEASLPLEQLAQNLKMPGVPHMVSKEGSAAQDVGTQGCSREGFTTAGQVQYVCRAGNFYQKGLPYTGALRVLKVILGYDYLWTRIRMKGGAYGCMSSFGRDGFAYFVTYRDPHLRQSIDTFEQAADYIRQFDADEVTMTKYVIGAVSAMDRPMTPSMFGRYSKNCRNLGLTQEDLQRDRDQVLDCGVEDIHALADYIDAFMNDNALCVIGSAGKIEEAKELFTAVEAL